MSEPGDVFLVHVSVERWDRQRAAGATLKHWDLLLEPHTRAQWAEGVPARMRQAAAEVVAFLAGRG